ncbi:hypothetical protein [Avibacterium paragallinarum]|uniref:Uncharacterized protein n=1 Tax=Avibacterium paragallinarum TaxID=728 RepID=A0ABU7QLM0_AVIPA|nr:hypothetical protein [Avibacterium paragallinarum]QZP14720.1 hypothetical protein K5O18_07670 [Avibacterium paragallinarum]WAL56601.1 hypothetical protein OY678_11810 [Avibacterium paragallinarum]WAM59149.1 hypothetical protein OW731_11680 [Avibacterium paragallinarum]
MKSKFKNYLIENNLANQASAEVLLSRLSDKLEIINCNEVETEILEDLLAEFLDTCTIQEIATLV